MVLHHYSFFYAPSYPLSSAILPDVVFDDFGTLLNIGNPTDVQAWPSKFAEDFVVPYVTKSFAVNYSVEEEE